MGVLRLTLGVIITYTLEFIQLIGMGIVMRILRNKWILQSFPSLCHLSYIDIYNNFSITTLLLFICVFLVLNLFLRMLIHLNYHSLYNHIPGPHPNPMLGNLYSFVHYAEFPPNFTGILAFCKLYEKNGIYVFWVGRQPIIVVYRPETVEEILSNSKEIEKPNNYDFLIPWLGRGLLTSTGGKWHSRRKMLTPAFHFKILDNVFPIINEQTNILIDKLTRTKGSIVEDIAPLITMCTLDIICETAMGVKINAQSNPDSEYVKSLYFIEEAVMMRNFDIMKWNDRMFYLSNYGKEYKRCLNNLHEFTRKVINERKIEIKEMLKNDANLVTDDINIGQRKRLAFLDLLLESHLSEGSTLSEEDIREEVDTFMFEGHDTTAMGITWSLYLLGLHEEYQQKIHDEIDDIFGDDRERLINSDDLKKMKFLECCIKESLRLYPSVPLIGRITNNAFKIKNYDVPIGSTVFVLIYHLHRNSDIYPNPEVFNPNRFLPEESAKRHPYAYVPFSAGPRNCIGQKFAFLEEKILIANVLRNFNIKSIDERDKIMVAAELITRPKTPIRMKFSKR